MTARRDLRGVTLDRRTRFTMTEVCRACSAEREFILELVAEGVIKPVGEAHEWRFHGEALLRAQRAHRLMQDLDVNLPGVALILDLLDELERLRRLQSAP